MSELAKLEGVGPKRLRLLSDVGIHTLRDLVYYLPRRYIDRTKFTPIGDLEAGRDSIFIAKVISLSVIQTRMVVEVEDETGTLELVFFNGVQFLRNRFFEGQRLLVAGTPTFFRDLQIVHPEFESLKEGQEVKGSILARYPLTAEMSAAHVEHKFLQKICLQALEKFSFSDAISEKDRTDLHLVLEAQMLKKLHRPETMEEIDLLKRQLKIRELLPLSYRLEAAKRERQKVGRSWPASLKMQQAFSEALPFTLTAGQKKCVVEITAGQENPSQYFGLLQGDVGAGKTAVAFMAMANVLANGGQVALMAPTEILATQHFQTLSSLFEKTAVTSALLTGDTSAEERAVLHQKLISGEIGVLVGTHALYSESVAFKNLGLVVVDEQHRFGVKQREAMAAKGNHPDILFMSATPIPRTLAQTVFGDMENLILDEKPAGRLPIKTRLVPAPKRSDMQAFLLKESKVGNQIFWVVPQIGKTEMKKTAKTFEDEDIVIPATLLEKPVEDIATLHKVEKELKAYSKDWNIGVVHGRLSADQKESVLKSFRDGTHNLLLATTVIEVGVDVPKANLMVIEGPDRFGVAQLHQLRGRTGRGSVQAWCFLAMPEKEWAPETLERLTHFSESTDGFKIAEMDLMTRGTGNLEGTDQSGYGQLRFTDLLADFALTQEMRAYARGEMGL